MKTREYAFILLLALGVALFTGCGSSGPVGTTSVEKATVTLSASFPDAGGARKSLIPEGTTRIDVYAVPVPKKTYPNAPTVTLTPSRPTATLQLPAGNYIFNARAVDQNGQPLGYASTGGELKPGVDNNVVLTFLYGQWTLVDANDNPSPLVLSDGTKLVDFIIRGGDQGMTAAKAAIDFSKPFGGGVGSVKLRFDTYTAAYTRGWMPSQFIGTTNSLMLASESVNVTKRCGHYDSYFGIPCEDSAGDQIVQIAAPIGSGSSGEWDSPYLYGNPESLLPNGGKTRFVQNGTPLDLFANIPETTVTNGTLMTGGVIEWKPTSATTVTLGTPVATVARSAAKGVKAQSSNTPYTGLTVTDYSPVVCSGSNPQNRGTWSFANNTSAGKIVIGSRVCYWDGWLNSRWDPTTGSYKDAGDYSWGLSPKDPNNLGDYCHEWDWTSNTCRKKTPGPGDVYNPWNFQAVRSATKTSIDYGSFAFNLWLEESRTGTAYIYPFRAKGSTSVRPFQPPQ